MLRIDAIPSTSLDSVREWLQSMDVKFYENKINLNWKPILKSILEARPQHFENAHELVELFMTLQQFAPV